MNHKSPLLHPFALFVSVWIGVLALYCLRLSKLLLASNQEIASVVALILIPFVLASMAVSLYFALAPKRQIRSKHLLSGNQQSDELMILKRRLKKWFMLWAALSSIEIVLSGGIPLVWLFAGSSKTYFDFGIQSLHGLLNSMILALGLCCTGIFAKFGNRRFLWCPLAILVWSILLVTRSMMIVNLLQSAMVIVLFRGMPGKLLIKLTAALLAVVVGFGALGDLRTGADNFRSLAQPTLAYPDWLPSGVLWVYIYVTTPLNNLDYTMASLRPVDNPLFPNTAAPLFPSIIRSLIYGDSLSASLSGELSDPNFNVSTAYVGPFEDYGAPGIIIFNIFIAIAAALYWRRSNFRDQLIYVVIGQCLLITIFYNHFFSLPIISQVIWIYLFFYKPRAKVIAPIAISTRFSLPLKEQ